MELTVADTVVSQSDKDLISEDVEVVDRVDLGGTEGATVPLIHKGESLV
jgi:hypothetical protein